MGNLADGSAAGSCIDGNTNTFALTIPGEYPWASVSYPCTLLGYVIGATEPGTKVVINSVPGALENFTLDFRNWGLTVDGGSFSMKGEVHPYTLWSNREMPALLLTMRVITMANIQESIQLFSCSMWCHHTPDNPWCY